MRGPQRFVDSSSRRSRAELLVVLRRCTATVDSQLTQPRTLSRVSATTLPRTREVSPLDSALVGQPTMLPAVSVGGDTTITATISPQPGERQASHNLAQEAGGDPNSHEALDADSADNEDGNNGSGSDESTQFDGASAEWSDTASYTSDNDDVSGSSSESDASRSSKLNGGRNRVRGGGRRRPQLAAPDSRTGGGDASSDPFAGRPTNADARRRRRRRERQRGEGGRGQAGSDAGYAEGNDSTTSLSDAGAAGNGSSSEDGSDDDADDPLEPIPGEVKLVPSMFPDRPPTVFFEYPKELGMARFNNVYFSEPLGARRLLFKSHWERNSVKNAFFRAGFSRTKSTMSWTASWGKHPTREGFRCGAVRVQYGTRCSGSRRRVCAVV